jgi:aldose 1-epimerase
MVSEVESIFNHDGKEVKLITLRNKNEMEVKLLNYGAAIAEILVPDRCGKIENVVLGYADYKDYINNAPYFGAIVGRTSGRIGKGSFTLDGKVHQLEKNNGMNSIHGGKEGFSFKVWDYRTVEEAGKTSVEFYYTSRDMEEGYPGRLDARVKYSLNDNNELHISYEALSDKKTLCNLTNHAYFNLSGSYKRKVTEQYLRIRSDKFLELDKGQAPTGRLREVVGTPMDFREAKLIGRDIESSYDQLILARGYDHPWLLSAGNEQVEMHDPESGRKLTVSTTYPCVVIYSYNFADNERLKYGKPGSKYDGICFEAQYEPDGIHHEGFNTSVLNAGELYHERTILKFTVL